MKYREIARKLRKLGCEEIPRRGKGSHRKWLNRATGRGTVIPDHGAKELKTGTVRAIVNQLGLELKEFEKI
jgi:predicted RNA binding protein YcfA (HicA-like mRNA interferase family)